MGHLYSKSYTKSDNYMKHRKTLLGINIEKCEAKIETRPTLIDERSSSVLKYRTPHFKYELLVQTSAIVKFPPMSGDEMWKVGWIQACTHMQFHNTYGDLGHSSWEFPELLSGEKPMVSDSDGKNFPWYGNKTEVVCVRGPQSRCTLHQVAMNDNFHPHITWDVPTASDESSAHTDKHESASMRLTRVKRDQKFVTWLAAMDVVRGDFVVLKTYKWRMNVEIEVDVRRALGERARLVSEPIQKQPVLLKSNLRIPNCALYPSNANSSQILVWHSAKNDHHHGKACKANSKMKKPLVILGPKCYKHNTK